MAVFDNRFVNLPLAPSGRRPTTLRKARAAAVLAFLGGLTAFHRGDRALFWLYWALALYYLWLCWVFAIDGLFPSCCERGLL